jgi:hypothetical protein
MYNPFGPPFLRGYGPLLSDKMSHILHAATPSDAEWQQSNIDLV